MTAIPQSSPTSRDSDQAFGQGSPIELGELPHRTDDKPDVSAAQENERIDGPSDPAPSRLSFGIISSNRVLAAQMRGHAPMRTAEPGLDPPDDLLGEQGSGYTRYLGRLTAVACIGGLLFGIDTGIASGMLVAIHQDLGHELSSGEQELIVSATTIGAIVGSMTAGRTSDWLGRKKVQIAASILFILGSVEQAAAQVLRELVLGRLLVGLGVGMASMVVPTYLAEIAPTSVRGRIVGLNNLLVTGGQVLAYTVNAAFYSLPHGWRWMVLAGGAPAIFQLVGFLYLDESPRWLIEKGRITSARHVLSRIYPQASHTQIDAQIERIQATVQDRGRPGITSAEDGGTSSRLSSTRKKAYDNLANLFREKRNRKALILACGLQFFQQMVGFNSLMYFSGRLLLMAGFTSNPNAAAILIAVANWVGTMIAMRYIDTWGRRLLLLHTTVAMTVALVLLGISFRMIDTSAIGQMADSTNTATPQDGKPLGAWPYFCLVAMVLFTLNYALGLGIVPWLVQSEVFAGPFRGIGGGFATATNWSANLLISATYLDIVHAISPGGTFFCYAVVSVFAWIFTYFRLPEMSGVSISDAADMFDDDQGLQSASAGGYAPVSGQDDADEEEVRDEEPGRH